ncbi:lipase chaperone, partial [Acinetobacter baumannii]
MQRMQKKIWWCVLGFFILSLIACVYWLSPNSENTSPQPNQD